MCLLPPPFPERQQGAVTEFWLDMASEPRWTSAELVAALRRPKMSMEYMPAMPWYLP